MKKFKLVGEFLGMGFLVLSVGFFIVFGVYRFFPNVNLGTQYLVSSIAALAFFVNYCYDFYQEKLKVSMEVI
jgi:Co/Zn/Cd efflux system component